jgi:hypothetical protein
MKPGNHSRPKLKQELVEDGVGVPSGQRQKLHYMNDGAGVHSGQKQKLKFTSDGAGVPSVEKTNRKQVEVNASCEHLEENATVLSCPTQIDDSFCANCCGNTLVERMGADNDLKMRRASASESFNATRCDKSAPDGESFEATKCDKAQQEHLGHGQGDVKRHKVHFRYLWISFLLLGLPFTAFSVGQLQYSVTKFINGLD